MDKEGNSFSKEVRSDRTRLWATWESVVAVNIKKERTTTEAYVL